jgi:hypothetical protein
MFFVVKTRGVGHSAKVYAHKQDEDPVTAEVDRLRSGALSMETALATAVPFTTVLLIDRPTWE